MDGKPLSPPQKKSVSGKQPNVMAEVQKQRGDPGRMSEMDILAKSSGGKTDPKSLYASLVYAIENDPKLRVMRANNSLFIFYNLGQGNAEVLLETADSPKKLVDSFKEFGQAMKKAGFKNLSFKVSNPDIIRVIKMVGGNPRLLKTSGNQMTATVGL